MVVMGLAALAVAGVSIATQAPPQAAFVILTPPVRGLGGSNEDLVRDTERALMALQEEGRLGYRRSAADPASLAECLTGGVEPSEERSACLRRLLPSTEGGVPVVAIAINYTLERGAWQRMECIGPRGNGLQRHAYVNQADHPRPDIRAAARAEMLQCVTEALQL